MDHWLSNTLSTLLRPSLYQLSTIFSQIDTSDSGLESSSPLQSKRRSEAGSRSTEPRSAASESRRRESRRRKSVGGDDLLVDDVAGDGEDVERDVRDGADVNEDEESHSTNHLVDTDADTSVRDRESRVHTAPSEVVEVSRKIKANILTLQRE